MLEQSVSGMFSLPAQSRRWELGHLLVIAAGLLSVGAAVIHFAVSPEHFQEYWGFGVFFVVVGWLQLAWAAAVLVSTQRAIVVGGAIGNAAVVVVWILSRVDRHPRGPRAWRRGVGQHHRSHSDGFRGHDRVLLYRVTRASGPRPTPRSVGLDETCDRRAGRGAHSDDLGSG
jgi:hypothetical protein